MTSNFMIKKTAAKTIVADEKFQIGSGVAEKLNENATKNLKEGIRRARDNGRKTVFPKDL